MDLQTALTEATSFQELAPIIKETWEGISCGGGRYVSMCNLANNMDYEGDAEYYSGRVHIDALALRVLELVRENPNFSEEERGCGQDIVSRIDRIYSGSDGRFKNQNIIARIISHVRDYFYLRGFVGKGPKFDWEGGQCNIFNYYTEEQHIKKFGRGPDKSLSVSFKDELDTERPRRRHYLAS